MAAVVHMKRDEIQSLIFQPSYRALIDGLPHSAWGREVGELGAGRGFGFDAKLATGEVFAVVYEVSVRR